MNKKLVLLALLSIALTSGLYGNEQDFGIKFSGFVKTDIISDSRQSLAVREGHFLLYPFAISNDANNEDINAHPSLNMLAIQTRLKGSITGPDAFGSKTAGLIEAAFFGHSDPDINGFRLRHAILMMNWQKTKLMIGQYWHPMFVTDCFPGTVSFNTGAPFQPFSRNPQVRITKVFGTLNIMAAAIAQRDFASTGPAGTSSIYLRNSVVPNLHLQMQAKTSNFVSGVGIDWKALRPRLVSSMNYKQNEKVNGLSLLGYASMKLPGFVWKMEGVLGHNLTDHLMLGGYAVESKDPATGIESYIPTQVFSAWTDISTSGKTSLGLFAGFTQNLGTANNILLSEKNYMRGPTIDAIFRIAPRIIWNSGTTRFATEVEYTAASYGTLQQDATVKDGEYVGNLRVLFAAYYFFN